MGIITPPESRRTGIWNRGPFQSVFTPLQRAMDQIRDDLDMGLSDRRGTREIQSMIPRCEVTEKKRQYVIAMDTPGLRKEDIKIDVNDQELTVSGERKEEKFDETDRQLLSETYHGSFMRTFSLPLNVDATHVDAEYKEGVLKITIPKTDKDKGYEVKIH